jgi:NADPH:quinone reductase-like Zn-dependent oxidoreductase
MIVSVPVRPGNTETKPGTEPHAGPGEVRVRVSAAGLNPVDWKIAGSAEGAARFGIMLPAGFGNDFAGVVDEVGEDVTGFAAGDRVYGGARGGAVADYAVVRPGADLLLHTPDGVGVFAVQLARRAGARVIGTASEAAFGFLRELGAEPVVYGDGLVGRVRALAAKGEGEVGGVTAAADMVGTETAQAAAELGVSPDRIATIAAASRRTGYAPPAAGTRRRGHSSASRLRSPPGSSLSRSPRRSRSGGPVPRSSCNAPGTSTARWSSPSARPR